jgi:hypothetical protein
MPRRSAILPMLALLALLALLAGCAAMPPPGPQRIGGFLYEPPSGPSWSGHRHPPGPDGQALHVWTQERVDGVMLQIQLVTFRPSPAIAGEAALADFAAGPDRRRSLGGMLHPGAACARYAQRLAPAPGAALPGRVRGAEEHGLFCLDPAAPGRLLHLRVVERTEPGVPTGTAAAAFEAFLPGFAAAP